MTQTPLRAPRTERPNLIEKTLAETSKFFEDSRARAASKAAPVKAAKLAAARIKAAKLKARDAERRDGPEDLPDEARFLRSWIERPLTTGAVSPSGRNLARAMAEAVDPDVPGPVIELGPGTGPVTEALLRRGVDEARLVLVEFNPEFHALLGQRFPRARVLRGDAYDLDAALQGLDLPPAAAVVSGLPLFTKPLPQRRDLLAACFARMRPEAPFVQFTYAPAPPVPREGAGYAATPSEWVFLNLPPARVWSYHRRAA